MSKITDLKLLFIVVAIVELCYALLSLIPPDYVLSVTGWVLNADGQWLAKILGMGLFAQAYIAWIFRKEPHLGVARALVFYQVGSATADWIMWLVLKNDGIFSTATSQLLIPVAIVTHYLIGFLLILGILRKNNTPT